MTNIIEQIAQTTYKINCIKELPELLISEFLKRQTVNSIFCFSFSVFVALVSVAAMKKDFEEGNESDWTFYWSFIILILSCCGVFYNLNQLFQIFFTPNLYLIENIKELVAK